MYSRPRFKDAHLKSTPSFEDNIFSKSTYPADIHYDNRALAFLPHGAPKITAEVHLQSCTESGLLLLKLLRAGMERFLPSASGSSAAGLKPCGEPTCSSSLNLSHRFPSALAGDPCMGFVVGSSERKATGSRESAQIARRGQLETRPAAAAVPWKWMTKTTSRTTAGDFLHQSPG